MNKFVAFVPVGKKNPPKIDKVEVFVNLLGFGEENAVKRNELVERCVGAGLISKDTIDKDRTMRNILKRARMEYVILNDCKGNGYYRATPKDRNNLSRSNKREDGRAISTFAGTKVSKAYEEDINHGRIEEG